MFDFESGGPNELSFVRGEVLTVVEKVCTENYITVCCIFFIDIGSLYLSLRSVETKV